jgi:putative ABC transport system permease protein
MAYVATSGSARLVQLRSVAPGWPWYGAIRTEPAGIWSRLQDGAAIVDPSLLTALGARVGDTLALGDGRYAIAGTVVNVPGEAGLQSAFGARVYVGHRTLPGTNLLGFGARVDHATYIRLPASVVAQDLAEGHRDRLRAERVRIRTVADDRDDLTQDLTRLGNFLGLVALAALLLGGLGTASAVHVLVRQRLDGIAVLRVLGASSRQVLAAHLIEALVVGLVGSIVGAAIGVALQHLMPLVLADFLPVDVRVRASAIAIATGIGLGLWTATVFAVLPLLAIRAVSPLATLRRLGEPLRAPWDWRRVLAIGVLGASVVALAAVQVGELDTGAAFAAAIGGALLVLWLAAMLLIRLARRFTPRKAPYLVRQGLANLHRPGNQTGSVVLALGFGVFLLGTLFAVQANLLRPLRIDSATTRANLVLFDIQTDQRDVVTSVLASEGAAVQPYVPIVPMRVAAVNGEDVASILARGEAPRPDSLAEEDNDGGSLWAFRREYRSTYRAEEGPAEAVIEGEWFGAQPSGSGRTAADPVAISVERDVAGELGLELGDSMVWNVQGASIHAVVRSIREVDWARFEPNFFVVFAPGALERAPQSWVTLARVDDPLARGRIQRTLAERAANVATVDLGEVQRAIESVIGKVVAAIQFMAVFSLVTGAVVLLGAIATSRWQRLREGALLRTLGATRAQVLRILAVEYAALGLVAALVAVVLSATAGWALARWVFESAYVLPLVPMLALAGGLALLTTAIGLATSLDVLRQPPLAVLRAE